jgi:hypothetical protein
MTAWPVEPYAPVVPAIAPMIIGFVEAEALIVPNNPDPTVSASARLAVTNFFKVPP